MRRILLAVLLFAAPLSAGEWGSRGITQRFAVRGDRVFAADGRGVAVYDVSRTPIRRVGVAETEAESTDVAVISDRDVAVATRGGVERFSVAADGTLRRASIDRDQIAPRIASNGAALAGITPAGITVWDVATRLVTARFFLSPPPAAIAWHGRTLIAAVPGTGVYFYDGGDPIIIPEDARDLAVAGDTLRVAAGPHGLVTFDLSGPAPKFVSRSGDGAVNFTAVAASSTRAFVVEEPDRVHVFDLTKETPIERATLTQAAQAIAAAGERLVVSGMDFDAFGVAGASGAPLRMFDAGDAAAPRFTGEFRDLAGPVSGVATDGTLAWVADRPYFRVIDVSTTDAPREIASLRIDGMGDRVKVNGKRAIVYGRGDVQLIDIGDPYAPRLISTYHSTGGPPSGAAFARDTIIEGNGYSGFHVVDFDHFAEPTQIGGLKGHYSDAAADGDTAWVMYFGSSLAAVDLSDPRNARVTATVPVGGLRTAVARPTERHGEMLVVLSGDGIHLLSAANPLNPIRTAFVPASASAIATDGDIAWIAGAGAVQTLDLITAAMQPAAMHAVAPMDIAASAGKVVIADRYSLRVYGPPPTPRRRPSEK